jgi:hypothetical protein
VPVGHARVGLRRWCQDLSHRVHRVVGFGCRCDARCASVHRLKKHGGDRASSSDAVRLPCGCPQQRRTAEHVGNRFIHHGTTDATARIAGGTEGNEWKRVWPAEPSPARAHWLPSTGRVQPSVPA